MRNTTSLAGSKYKKDTKRKSKQTYIYNQIHNTAAVFWPHGVSPAMGPNKSQTQQRKSTSDRKVEEQPKREALVIPFLLVLLEHDNAFIQKLNVPSLDVYHRWAHQKQQI